MKHQTKQQHQQEAKDEKAQAKKVRKERRQAEEKEREKQREKEAIEKEKGVAHLDEKQREAMVCAIYFFVDLTVRNVALWPRLN